MERKPSAPRVNAEDLQAESYSPIGKRSLFEVADIVFMQRDPVVTHQNFAAGVGVGRVDVILKWRGEMPWAEKSRPRGRKEGKWRREAVSARKRNFTKKNL